MKIALIDIGISKKEIDNSLEVRHFYLDKGELIEGYKEPKGDHGTRCFKEIISNSKSKDIQIFDLNISDDSGNLQVLSMVSAIEKSINERVDMINISLGLTSYSQELYDICERAVQNNIVVLSAASHSNTVSFPADFNNVICVKVNQDQTEKIRTVDNTAISVSMRDYIVKEKDAEFDFSSSSMASARLCGYFCNEFGDMSLNDKYKLLTKKYNIKLHNTDGIHCNDIFIESGIQNILADNRIAVVLFPANALHNVNREILHKNILAYYDHEKEGFYSFREDKETKEFDVIIVLNTSFYYLEAPEMIKEKYSKHRIIYIGNFLRKDDNQCLREYSAYSSLEMTVLERPVIAVTSLCSGLNKSDIQISLLNSLMKDGLDIKAVSNNPIGMLYDMEIFNFPMELKFPDAVYCINKFMYLTEANSEIDAWLINIGGAVGQVNILNTYNFGKLADAYFSAANVDVAIMCVNPFVDASNLQLQLANLYKHGIEKIFIVLSHNEIDASTMDSRDGLQTYYVDDAKYLKAFEYLVANVKEQVYTLDDVWSGKLYENVLAVLS